MNRLIQKKIKAGALQYALFISVLIALFISAFLLLNYLNSHYRIVSNNIIKSVQLSDDTFRLPEVLNSAYNLPNSVNPADENEEILTSKSHWGFFDVLKVESTVKTSSHTKVGLIGGHQYLRPSVYLSDRNQPLVVVGSSTVQGNAFLPLKGVRRGNIAGKSYYGTQLIYGQTHRSSATLPEIEKKRDLKELFTSYIDNPTIEFIALNEGMSLTHSFLLATKLYYSTDPILLSNIELQGNIVIQSEAPITIDSTASLKDIVLIAPEIIIEKGVTGNFQAFATKSIFIDENVLLHYPSVISVFKEEIKEEDLKKPGNVQLHPDISIGSNTVIKGIIAYFSESSLSNYLPQIQIAENTMIYGEIYCEKNMELKGNVYGSVYTDQFITRARGSVYLNHLFNANVLSEELAPEYVGLNMAESSKKVAKWLY